MSSTTSSRYRESAAVTAPSKVHDQNNTSFAEEHALDAIAKEAEVRLQHQREQNREARQLRHKELEKNARDDEFGDSTTTPTSSSRSRLMSVDGGNNSAMGTNNNSSLLQKFLNGDVDLRTIEQRDLRRLLSELETKYKAAMIANSSIYNEKQALRYQVDTFKDILDEHYETLNQAKRQYKEKSRDYDFQKRAFNDLQQEFNQLKEILDSREKLIQESGMLLLTDEETNGNDDKLTSVLPTGLVAQETLSLLNSLGKGSIDVKLKQLLNEKQEQSEQILQLKVELEQQKEKYREFEQISKQNDFKTSTNSVDSEQQKQLIKELTELRNRVPRLEAENLSIQQENKRFDAQLKRQKQQLTEMETIEEELKQERRKLQKELRAVRDELDNERTRSDVLQRENERLRIARKKTLLNPTDDSLSISAIVSRSHTNSPLPPTISSSSSISALNDPHLNPSSPEPT